MCLTDLKRRCRSRMWTCARVRTRASVHSHRLCSCVHWLLFVLWHEAAWDKTDIKLTELTLKEPNIVLDRSWSPCVLRLPFPNTHTIFSGANLLTTVTINCVKHLPRATVKQPCEKGKISNMCNTYSMIRFHVHYPEGIKSLEEMPCSY